MRYDGPVKCTLLLEDPTKPEQVKIELEHEDGSPVLENELVDIGGNRWPHHYPREQHDYTWSFKNHTSDIADKYWQQRCMTATFRTFSLILKNKYRFVKNPGFRTDFLNEFTHDLSVFNDRKSVLAQAYLFHERNSKDVNGLTQWNDNHFFTPFGDTLPAYLVDPDHYTEGQTNPNGELVTLRTQPMLEIDMHEKYHNHGERHDDDFDSMLYPIVKPGYAVARKFFPDGTNTLGTIRKESFLWWGDDIKRLHEDYDARFLPSFFRTILQKRRLNGRFVDNVVYRVVV